MASTPNDSTPRLSTLPTCEANQPFNATLQLNGVNVPPRLSASPAPVPASSLIRLYDDPAGPALLSSGSSEERGSSSYPCWKVHELALLAPPAAPQPMWPLAAEPTLGGGPPDQWVEADGRRLPGARAVPRFHLGAASGQSRVETPDVQGLATVGPVLQMWQQSLLSPSSQSEVAVNAASLPVETATATRYCI